MAGRKGKGNDSMGMGMGSNNLAPNQIRHQTKHILAGTDTCPECDNDADDGPLGEEMDPDAKIGPVTLHPQTDGSVAVNYKHKVRSHDELGPHIKHLFKGGSGSGGGK